MTLTGLYVAVLTTSVETQGVRLGNVIAPPVAPLTAVTVPDVNVLGILDGTAPGWTAVTNLDQRIALQQMGKALFWDMQLGGDGVQACASCHYHAGADNRRINQLSPGLKAGDTVHDLLGPVPNGPNATLTPGTFSRIPASEAAQIAAGAVADEPNGDVHAPVKANPLDDVNDVLSSQGVRLGTFTGLSAGRIDNHTLAASDDGFNRDFTTNAADVPDTTRRVEPRNSPTTLNAVYNFRNFWDGRGDAFFNGRNPLGFRDPGARVQVYNPGTGLIEDFRLRIPFSSLASQAVGPPLSQFEMHFDPRMFPDLGKKMTRAGMVPLDGQDVSGTDPLLGSLTSGEGLTTTYDAMIRAIFKEQFWGDGTGQDVCLDAAGAKLGVAPAGTCGSSLPATVYTLLQWNFSMFFGLSVQAYEATLTTENTIVDLINGGVATGLVNNGFAVGSRNFRQIADVTGLSLDACIAGLSVNANTAVRAAAPTACANHYVKFIGPNAVTGTESATAVNPVGNGTPIGGCLDPTTCAASPNQTAAVATLDNVSRGMGRFFAGATGCAICHFNPEFTGNTVSALTGFGAAPLEPLAPGQVRKVAPERPMERMIAFNGFGTVYDSGFYNLGVRPSPEDLSIGDSIGGVPLAYSKLADALNGGSVAGMDAAKLAAIAAEFAAGNVLQIPTSPADLTPRPWTLQLVCGPGLNGNGNGIGEPNNNPVNCIDTVIPGERLLRNGAFHTQGLRNVKFTGPYMHNGSKVSIRQVVEFYKTAGHFPTLNFNNLDAGLRIFNLGVADESSLVEFMETGLTDWRVASDSGKFSHPQLCVPNGHDPVTGVTNLADVPASGASGHVSNIQTFAQHLAGAGGAHNLSVACTMTNLADVK